MPDKHAKHSPSTLKAKKLCPAWRNDNTADTTAADAGTKCHVAAELNDFTGLDEDQIRWVEWCQKYVADQKLENGTWHTEVRVEIPGVTWGTADLLFLQRDKAHIFDYKFGAHQVDPPYDNLQIKAYVAGTMHTFAVSEVVAHIVQPRCDFAESAYFDDQMLIMLESEIRGIVDAASAEVPEQRVNDMCQFCGKRAECNALGQVALTTAKQYSALTMPEQFHPSKITDPEQMAHAKAIAAVLEPWIKSVKHHSNAMAARGIEVPGYHVRNKAGRLSLSAVDLAVDVAKGIVDPSSLAAACSLSLPKLKQVLMEDLPGVGKDVYDELVGEWEDAGLLERGAPVSYLVKDSKRTKQVKQIEL